MLPGTRATFQAKKAVKMCAENGGYQCEEMVDGMSKEAILDYIKDDKVTVSTLNYGYIYTKDKDTRLAGR